MTSRWTQYEEDSCRLPEGFIRIGYDADTRRYIFKDKHGAMYQGEPGLDYGTLIPLVPTTSAVERVRPSAFSTSSHDASSPISPPAESIPKTFHDILPPELITSSTLSGYARQSQSQTSSKLARDKFKESVRRTALPKMHNVVTNLRRSVTSMRKPRASPQTSYPAHHSGFHDEDTRRLVQRDSSEAVNLSRSFSVSTSHTSGMPNSESHSSPTAISGNSARQL